MATALQKNKTARRNRAGKRAAEGQPEWKLRRASGLQILEASAFAKLPWIIHGFSTCPGGVSELPHAIADGERDTPRKPERVLNLGFSDWDLREHVAENRARFFRAVSAEKLRLVALRQIHSDIVHIVPAKATAGSEFAPQGDALIAHEPHVLLTIQTADCVPILLADTKRRVVAAIHSGWRGTLRRVAAKTLGRMQMEFGTCPEDVIAALGPGIGRCCYEVGEEVAKEFHAQFSHARDWFDGPFDALAAGENDPSWLPWLTMMPPGHQPAPPRVRLDLIAANRAILAGAGVASACIFSSGYCTACRTDLFFSYRRERTTGRLMAAIGIR